MIGRTGDFLANRMRIQKELTRLWSGNSNHIEHVKAVITLRNGKNLENSVEPPKDSSPAEKETEVDQTSSKDPNGPENAKSPSKQMIDNALLDLGASVNLPFSKISGNVFKALQAPPDPEHNDSICMIDSLVENTFTINSVSDPLKACSAHFGAYYDEDKHFEEVNALLDSAAVMNYGKWQPKPETLPPTMDKPLPSSVKAPTLELKPLPDTLKYVFLGNENTLPVIIASDLEPDQESRLVSVLREHKTAIGWTIEDLKGISLVDCMHHIYLEEGAKTSREVQRRLNHNMKEVVRTEVLKLLDAGIIYLISDTKWVRPIQVVPRKSGITVVANENNELIHSRVTTGWRVCIDYHKLNSASRKDHFPLPFIDQML
ncbi:uncharacterized protein LOC113305592 [Papaver somniferum]|uniref:uncharacterized protein LOC113305592 n=1 Tax=Papaver somniferum TaxID=3469 RepID=UPI000E6FE23B|nr:uncharacterized protein LOC113305592 [Papaver somniferum]